MKICYLFCILAFNIGSANAQFWDFIQVTESIDFESSNEYVVLDTSESNIWQIAPPQKVVLSDAYSPTHVIITDSILPYPPNATSHFDVYLSQENSPFYPNAVFLRFKHKICTETNKDGGFVSYSCDLGNTWMNVLSPDNCIFWEIYPGDTNYDDGTYRNLYSPDDTLFNGEPGFSGCSDDWEEVILDWFFIPVAPPRAQFSDTMIVRFNFISDSLDIPFDGWMIDDIEVFIADLGSNVNDRVKAKFEVFPNPVASFLNVKLEAYYPNIRIQILTTTGAQVYSSAGQSSDNIRIDIPELPNGLYLLKLESDQESLGGQKFIVQH